MKKIHDTTTSFLEEMPAKSSLSGKKTNPKEAAYTVVKRNGMLVPFRRDRIFKAIEAAFRDTKKIAELLPLDEDLQQQIEHITNLVVKQILHLASKGTSLTVEGIQDVVEVTLMKNSFHDVARDYILYRDSRKEAREGAAHTSLKIYRKDKTTPTRFNPMKIASSIEKTFRSQRSIDGQMPDDLIDTVNLLTKKIVAEMTELAAQGNSLYIDMIEDRIERELMAEKHFDVAKFYILYRAEKAKRQETIQPSPLLANAGAPVRTFDVTTSNGQITINEIMLRNKLAFACRGLENKVSLDELLETAISQFYSGMKEHEVDLANIFAAKSKIEKEPAYSQVASRLLLDCIYRETIDLPASDSSLVKGHRHYLKKYIKFAIANERLSPKLLDFDLDELGDAMDLGRDDLFNYLGLQTLYDRYFIHHEQRRLETPQIFWMRVAMGIALNEGEQKNKRAIEFYNVLSQFYFTSSTPTLFNSGTLHSQLSSCFLSTTLDDLHHIFKVIADDAQLSKWAGGIGNDWTNVRATGAHIKGTNGTSQGVIPFLKVANDTAVAVNQCFNPDTRLFTARGILPIAHIDVKDLVLGKSGIYRQVTNRHTYPQKGPMISLKIKHSLEPLHVTSAHPFYVLQGIPSEANPEMVQQWLAQGRITAGWVDANQLQIGDYVAQVIPKETVAVSGFTEEDARFYGILLGNGHLSEADAHWSVSGHPRRDSHLEFIRHYLKKNNIYFWETRHGHTHLKIHWDAVQSGSANLLPFSYDDMYDAQKMKHIAPRLAHLPRPQALALLQGLLEKKDNLSRGKEIIFSNASLHLIEGVRYQCLRFGIPTTGNRREKHNSHTGKTAISYTLRIPIVTEFVKKIGVNPGVNPRIKKNWLETPGFVWSRIIGIENVPEASTVCDLIVDSDHSYMTTTGLAHNGGKRRGAIVAYLETWHLDIEEFLELRKNTGDERRRTHDMNTANWIPDLFMKRVREGGIWTLFNPSDVPDLHDLYGAAFEKRYLAYEKKANEGKIKLHKKIEAIQLWRKMLSMLFETGHPWITFKDPSNIRSPQDHVGVVHSSNLCTEILLNTSENETAVCNLGSINLANHVNEKGLDENRIASTVRTAIRMLDNVIDINFYPTIEAKNSNIRHRPIGLGLMGFQDALYIQNISYASHEAVEFADQSMEMLSYYAILASTELAQERGPYSTYKGSKWDRGYLPIDTIALLEKERGMPVDIDRSCRMDWQIVRDALKSYGIRNSNTMAIAPTATIGNITGVIPSNEPIYKHLFVKSNLSGEFTIINPYLVEQLKRLQLWDEEMIDDLKYFDGTIRDIERIPNDVKNLFLTAFEIEPEWIIECAARRQKWIDMGQSLNLYLAEPSGKKLHQMYTLGWEKGLKTLYYLRTLGATQIEKSTLDINKRGLQPRWMKNKSASSSVQIIRDEEMPKACHLGEECESCQ